MRKRIYLSILLFLLTFSACQPDGGSDMDNAGTQSTYPLPLVIAHRGARSIAPENTILAAQKAFELGADLWELDVAMTYDEELVVIHDDTLKRTSNAAAVFPKKMPWNVRLFTLEELKTLDFGSWFIAEDPFGTINNGAVSVEDQEEMKAIQIPTLEEALIFTKSNHWRVNIEIKDLSGTPGDALVVEKVIALVEKLDMVPDVIISSFNHEYLSRCKKINPEIATGVLVNQQVNDPISLVNGLNAQAYNPGINKIGDLSKIQSIRDAGIDVYVWTVNDETTMRKLIKAGVSGIFTDDPELLRKVLSENSPNN